MTRNIVGTGSDSTRDDTVSGRIQTQTRAARSEPTTKGHVASRWPRPRWERPRTP